MSEQRKSETQHVIKSTSCAYESRTDPPDYIAMVYFDGEEPEDVITEDGIEYERTVGVKVWESIPIYAKRDIAEAAWNAFQEFMRRPDAQEILDAEKERLIREGSTLLDPRPRRTVKAK